MKKFTITEYTTGANGYETSETYEAPAAEALKALKAGYKVRSTNAARTRFGYFNKKAEAVKAPVVVEEEDFLAVLLG